jgi:hypothetical protein
MNVKRFFVACGGDTFALDGTRQNGPKFTLNQVSLKSP